MPRVLAVVASVLIHVGLVATAVRIGLPVADFPADVIAAELMAPEPVAPPPRKAEPPAPRVAPPPPKPKPAPPETRPKLIDAPPPKIEERRVEEAPPVPPPAPPPAIAKRDDGAAPASSTPPARSPDPPASPLPAGVSAITSEPPLAPPRPSAPAAGAPATPGPSAAIAPDAVTRTAIPRGGYQVRPSYPSSARRLGVEGTTMLRIHVSAEGRVDDVVVETSAGHRDLDQAAVEAVRRWRFEPARRGTEAVAMWVRLPVEFRLR